MCQLAYWGKSFVVAGVVAAAGIEDFVVDVGAGKAAAAVVVVVVRAVGYEDRTVSAVAACSMSEHLIHVYPHLNGEMEWVNW